MKVIANENIPESIVKELSSLGYEVIDLKKMSPRMEDTKVAKKADEESAIVLTSDKDYLGLLKKHSGLKLVLLRFLGGQKEKGLKLAEFLHTSGCLKSGERVVVVRWEGETVSLETPTVSGK